MKLRRIVWILLLVLIFPTSCSMDGLLSPAEPVFSQPDNRPEYHDETEDYAGEKSDIFDGENNEGQVLTQIHLTILDDILDDEDLNTDREPVQMEISLFFSDKALVGEGKLGPYGFVSPVTRNVPAVSGILKKALDELIKGPLAEEKGLSPVIPPTARVNRVTIRDGIAKIDFNKAFVTDHPGGTLGGAITMQALIFTASQFDSVDGVLVTVEGKPWNDGHFIWDQPMYEEDLLNSLKNNN
jgi:hypothetical protein